MTQTRFDGPPAAPPVAMPTTRFAGSKRKFAGWIGEKLEDVEFDTVLDAFGGTGSVAFEFKRRGKSVTYNDLLRCNFLIGRALIANGRRRLHPDEIEDVVRRHRGMTYGDFVERTFEGIYYTDDENRWLDTIVGNIGRLKDPTARALAYHALFQSALAKRPYNLFHRKNLYMRQARVDRSFGNKTTWDRPFADHFRKFADEANSAVFDNGRVCRAMNRDALDIEGTFDLVYIDPPYVSAKGVGVPYRDFYHFLEGLARYAGWHALVDYESRHRKMISTRDPWARPATVGQSFEALFDRLGDSALAISYRSDGIPSIGDIKQMLTRRNRRVTVFEFRRYQYALSTNVRSREVLLIAT